MTTSMRVWRWTLAGVASLVIVVALGMWLIPAASAVLR